jgi:hypothetical protein
MGISGCFPGVKGPGHEADHSPPSTAEVKNGGAIILLFHTYSYLYLYFDSWAMYYVLTLFQLYAILESMWRKALVFSLKVSF